MAFASDFTQNPIFTSCQPSHVHNTIHSDGRPKREAKTESDQMNERRTAVAEIRRELRVRRCVYPKLVNDGRLSPDEAARRLSDLELAATIIEREAAPTETPTPTTVQSVQ